MNQEVQLVCKDGKISISVKTIEESPLLATLDLSQDIPAENYKCETISQIAELYNKTEGKLPTVSKPIWNSKFLENLQGPNIEIVAKFFENHDIFSVRDLFLATSFLRLDKLKDLISCFIAVHFHIGSDAKRIEEIEKQFKVSSKLTFGDIEQLFTKYAWLNPKEALELPGGIL